MRVQRQKLGPSLICRLTSPVASWIRRSPIALRPVALPSEGDVRQSYMIGSNGSISDDRVRQRSAIYGRSTVLSHGHSNVWSAPDSGPSRVHAYPLVATKGETRSQMTVARTCHSARREDQCNGSRKGVSGSLT